MLIESIYIYIFSSIKSYKIYILGIIFLLYKTVFKIKMGLMVFKIQIFWYTKKYKKAIYWELLVQFWFRKQIWRKKKIITNKFIL